MFWTFLLLMTRPALSEDFTQCVAAAAKEPRTHFEVLVGTYPTVVDRGLSLAEINRLHRKNAPPKGVVHGYSLANYRLRYTTRSQSTHWPFGGRACAWLGSVVVDLTPEGISVYIPREYAPDSCESRQLLAHEMEHERLHRAKLEEIAKRMRRLLTRAQGLPGPSEPVTAKSPKEAYGLLQSTVDKEVRPLYEEFLEAIELDQRGLDDSEHYRRLGESCSGWK
jgi:hypothetical protein